MTMAILRHSRCLSTPNSSTRSGSSSIASSALLFFVHLLAFLGVCCSSLQPQHRTSSVNHSRRRGGGVIMASSSAAATSAAAVVAKRLVNVGKLHPSQTVLLLCDVQERFRPLIHKMETVINTCQYMTSVCQTLHVPILATQQYTKVFGPTITDCFADSSSSSSGSSGIPSTVPVLEKKKFSMLTDEVRALLMDESSASSSSSCSSSSAAAVATAFGNRPTYIIMGIEAHVCVQQTCLDLLEQEKHVHVICDGVSSQQASDRIVALRRLEKAGAFLTTAQSAAFMLLQSADHECFKQVSKLTVEHMKKVNEFNIPQENSLDII